MAQFDLNGISLHIPDRFLNEYMVNSLKSGRYESAEHFAVSHHISAGDRVLELGGGAGYLSVQIANAIGPENLVTVEANKNMIAVISNNLMKNKVSGVNIICAAVVSDDDLEETTQFHIAPAFWGSSLAQTSAPNRKTTQIVEVPTVRISEILDEFKPTFVFMDIEGAEIKMFNNAWPKQVRVIIMELHPKLYPSRKIKHIFDRLSIAGFTYCPAGSRGDVVVFKRVTELS